MKELLEKIKEAEDTMKLSIAPIGAKGGFLGAMHLVRDIIDELLADKKTRWAIIKELDAINAKESMREILKKRFG